MAASREANFMPYASPVIINKIGMADPTGPRDTFNIPHDWIELYNRSDKPYNLKNCQLSDNPRKPKKWILPNITLGPKQSTIIWATGEQNIFGSILANTSQSRAERPWSRTYYQRHFSGFIWRWTNTIQTAKHSSLGFTITIPKTGTYQCWLRLKNNGPSHNRFQCNVDNQTDVTVFIKKPHKQFKIIELSSPHTPNGHWHFSKGKHIIRVENIIAPMDIDYLVATDPYATLWQRQTRYHGTSPAKIHG